jgi:hypothetical protein
MDMSTHCKGYLPLEISTATSNSAVNTIFFVDKANKNQIYLYTMRTNGDKMIQNAFSRWILSTNDTVLSMKGYEKDLYIVSKRPKGDATYVVCPYYTQLESVPITTPLLDWLTLINSTTTIVPSGPNQTAIILPHYDPDVNCLVLNSDWGTSAYTSIDVTSNNLGTIVFSGDIVTTITIPGNYVNNPSKGIWVGRKYEMNVELSRMVPRSEDGSTVFEGVLNLKRITTRHLYTGNYDLVVTRNNRDPSTTTYFTFDLNSRVTTLGSLKLDTVGEHYARLLSYSENCKIQIKSSYPTPCNISNIEILGNYRKGNTGIE